MKAYVNIGANPRIQAHRAVLDFIEVEAMAPLQACQVKRAEDGSLSHPW